MAIIIYGNRDHLSVNADHSTGDTRPLLQYPSSLPDRRPRPWPLLDKTLKDAPGHGEVAPGEQHLVEPLLSRHNQAGRVRKSPSGCGANVINNGCHLDAPRFLQCHSLHPNRSAKTTAC